MLLQVLELMSNIWCQTRGLYYRCCQGKSHNARWLQVEMICVFFSFINQSRCCQRVRALFYFSSFWLSQNNFCLSNNFLLLTPTARAGSGLPKCSKMKFSVTELPPNHRRKSSHYAKTWPTFFLMNIVSRRSDLWSRWAFVG